MMKLRSILAFSTLLLPIAATAADWTQFRGPNGSATSEDTGLPVTWSSTENIVWKRELPGLGTSSPITLGDRIFLSCYRGYGEVPNEGNVDDLSRQVVCLRRETGEILWVKDFAPELPESEYRPGNSSRHGYSSSTPVTDGLRLYVFFGKSGVYCLDLDGNPIWHVNVGSRTNGWGSGASPVLYRDLLIVNASVESSSLVALNKESGEEVWRTEGVRGTWGSPVLVEVPGGSTEVVLSLPGSPVGKIVGYDPATGEALWNCDGIADRGYVCPTVIAHDGIVYAIGGRQKTAVAVRAGGRGDVTETHRLWKANIGSNVSSPVYYNGHLYWANDRGGMVYCVATDSGETVYERRLESPESGGTPGNIYSSPVAVDGKLYYVSQFDGTFVVAAKPEFELLAHNVFGDDDSRTNACPVVSRGRLLLRSDRFLYCIGTE